MEVVMSWLPQGSLDGRHAFTNRQVPNVDSGDDQVTAGNLAKFLRCNRDVSPQKAIVISPSQS